MSDADAEAVRLAHARGIRIVLNTNRWYGLAQRTAQRLELPAPLICQNGAHIKEPEDGPELLHLRIPQEAAREIAAFCDEGGLETYTTVDSITYMRTPREAEIDPQRLPKDMRLARTHAEYIVGPVTGFTVGGEESVRKVVDAFADRYGDVLNFSVGWSQAYPMSLTITIAGVDKGTALRLVCEHLGVPLEEAMAVGDMAPDVTMFEVAGLGVAMGNAPQDVKEQADTVAPSNSEGGVAWAIRRFVLEGS